MLRSVIGSEGSLHVDVIQDEPEELRELMCETSYYEQGGSARHFFISCSAIPSHYVNICVRNHAMSREGVLAMFVIPFKASPRNYVNACGEHHAINREGVLAMIFVSFEATPKNYVNACV